MFPHRKAYRIGGINLDEITDSIKDMWIKLRKLQKARRKQKIKKENQRKKK